jgi:hypothetical protein
MQGYGLNLSCPLRCHMPISHVHLNQALSMYEYTRSFASGK